MKVFCLLSLLPIGRYCLYHCFLWLFSQPSGMGPTKVRLLVWWRWSGVACSRRRAVYESGGSRLMAWVLFLLVSGEWVCLLGVRAQMLRCWRITCCHRGLLVGSSVWYGYYYY